MTPPTTARVGTTRAVAGDLHYLWIEEDGRPVVLASGWDPDPESMRVLVHAGLRPARIEPGNSPVVDAAVAAYNAGDFAALDAVEVRQRSGEFMTHAWQVLRQVPPGEVIGYTELAERAGRPAAARAAASACARNAAALFVPCHRVRRKSEALGGFRYGVGVKAALLEHESV